MRLKLSLDPNSIKQFFVDHGEKVLFGLVVLGFLLFVYRAVARETLPWQPQDLVADAQAAQQNIASTKPEPLPIPPIKDEAEGLRRRISEADYALRTPWEPPKFPENRRRGMPELLPVKDLRVGAGNGAFAMAPDEEELVDLEATQTMTMTRGRRWVVMTGLIQHLKQKELYDAAFQDAVQWNPQRDYPDYVAFKVERAEVDPRVQTAELNWTPVPAREMLAQQDYWLQSGGELVDEWYLPPPRGTWMLAFPLGPLQNRTWGPEVAHPPEIPLREPTMGMTMGYAEEGAMPGMPGMPGMYARAMGKRMPRTQPGAGTEKPATEAEVEEDPAKAAEAARKALAERRRKAREKAPKLSDEPDVLDFASGTMGGMGPMPGMGTMGDSEEMYGSSYGPRYRPRAAGRSAVMPSMTPGMIPGTMSAMGPGMRRPYGRYPTTATEEEGLTEEQQEVEYLLFRFFDFSVVPGKHYRYRVKLVLLNPNLGMLPHYVEKEGMEKQKFLETPWSDPSPVVSVPLDSQVLLASARSSDGSASVLLVRFNERDGAVAAEEFPVVRGQLLNYRDRTFEETRTAGIIYEGMAPTRATTQERKVDYLTQALVLDTSGGGRLPGRDRSLVEPGSILLLDAEGNLVVREELDDLPDYRFYKPPEVTQPAGMPVYAGAEGMIPNPGDYEEMMGSMAGPGMRRPPAKAAKGAKGSSAAGSRGMMPGMTPGMMPPGMMPGSTSSGTIDELDSGSRRKPARRPRGSSGS